MGFVVESLRLRVRRIPAWVTVMVTAAVVGAISAMLAVSGLARVRRDRPALEVPISTEEGCEAGDTSE